MTHPAVAPLLEVDSVNGFHYLVWPAADGERLADRVAASGPVPAGEAAALFGHLASALAACHARAAVHGALTPHAVAVVPSGLPRLLELGAGALLAQSVADDEALFDSMSAALGSAAVLTYAAPELAADPGAATAAADQYALGAVGYFAVTGLPPYPHPALAEQLRAKRAGPPPSAAIVALDVPAELAAVFERMMAPDPADRFPTLEEVEERLAELATADPVRARRAAGSALADAVQAPDPRRQRGHLVDRDRLRGGAAADAGRLGRVGHVRPAGRARDTPRRAAPRAPVHDPAPTRATVETPPGVASPPRAEPAPRPERAAQAPAN